ncbi:MAG TPA: hypothetical protein VFA03_04720 [Acetobacteraceae bacterium]|nr:hypothetical protein [Acetobacteraceae bacterium]
MAEKELIAALAKAAGLERAWAAFPDDVTAAAEQALGHAAALSDADEPGDEPWPPMRVETAW